jgi:cyclic pyranopterin phosphate synthase
MASIISRLVNLFGVNKIRITGGEPMLRRDIEVFISMLSEIKGIGDLAMTTNGTLLCEKSAALKTAGLNRVNISVDSLNPEKFNSITRGGDLEYTKNAVKAASDAGLAPVKINTVLLQDFDEEMAFVKWTAENNYRLRFIELMPNMFNTYEAFTGDGPKEIEILDRLSQYYAIEKSGESEPEPGCHVNRYRISELDSTIEFIPGVSEPFCDDCNRFRIDCQGKVRSCLYSDTVLNLSDYIESPDEEFALAVVKFLSGKADRPLNHIGSGMSSIGG